jgi:hypothetical protein
MINLCFGKQIPAPWRKFELHLPDYKHQADKHPLSCVTNWQSLMHVTMIIDKPQNLLAKCISNKLLMMVITNVWMPHLWNSIMYIAKRQNDIKAQRNPSLAVKSVEFLSFKWYISKVHLKQTVDDGNKKRLNATFMKFYNVYR